MDINDPAINGVALPGSKAASTVGGPIPHAATRHEAYARYVNRLIISAPNKEAAIHRLNNLRHELATGVANWPGKR